MAFKPIRRVLSEHAIAKLDLLITLVRRDLSAKYKGSILGNLWPLLNQLSQLVIYTYVFSVILKVKLSISSLPDNNLTFGLWVFAGLVPWFAITSGLIQAAGAVINQANLVKKVVFPLALLPLVPVLTAFVESTMGLVALIVVVGFSSQVAHATLWLLPLVWFTQLLFTAGLGYLVAGLTVFLRDIPQTLMVFINLWFYMTPIVYPADRIPAAWRWWILWFNPAAAICEVYRDLVLEGRVQHWYEWGSATVIAIVMFAIGYKVYQRLRPAFADVL
ncbi:ABC transporter permease [Thalassoporum mexicanum]|uniref:ABC transporter permease n=1 Tax=Thalassoporum mexicanum TaxID=3457544 RepID=UPI0012EA06D8